jgi:hypothetical protein
MYLCKGSTVTAMADAIDQAACVVYAVTEKYKESANCRKHAHRVISVTLELLCFISFRVR